jgi:hypothetical protein
MRRYREEAFFRPPSPPLFLLTQGIQRTRRSITEMDLQRLNVHPSSRQQWIDEVQAEISMCLGMLYPIVEVFRNDDEFAEELSTYSRCCCCCLCYVENDGLT